MRITDQHAMYFAHELTKRCASDSVEKLAGALAGAQVDLNPHQIDAALFAFTSPLSKGALLADEVGLLVQEAGRSPDSRGHSMRGLGLSQLLIRLGQSLFGGLGFVWLFLETFYALGPAHESKVGFMAFLFAGLMLGCIWFAVDGWYVTGFLKRSIEITSNAIDAPITVMFGDVFAQDGCKAVSVNEFFDSAVDEKHVASNTLHGAMLTQCWAGNTADWDRQVAQDLTNTSPVDVVATRPPPGKRNRYPIGTTASVTRNGHAFLCVVLTRTCTTSLEASATSDDLQHAVRGLLAKARTVCSGRPLNIPLLGSGLARTGIKPNIIVDLMLLAIFEESRTRKITNHIRIVLPIAMRTRIDLTTIGKDWR